MSTQPRAAALEQHELRFRAMGTEVGAWLWCSSAARARSALADVQRFFTQAEARLSRFLPASELNRLNRAAGQPFSASPLLYEQVARALDWWARSDGIFDPTILRALEGAGYDRPFTALAAQGASAAHVQGAGWVSGAAGVRLGNGRTITLPPGVGVDLGGIAKGWAVQQAAQRLAHWGACLVDAGGDIACVGAPPQAAWVVTVADAHDPARDVAVIGLRSEAVATSTRAVRKWTQAGKPAHHLIDPRTGAPAETDLLSVTVVGPRLPDVEIHAKVALILGSAAGAAYLQQQAGVAALLALANGDALMTGNFEERAYVSTGHFAERFRVA